jgi:hypothetical protein
VHGIAQVGKHTIHRQTVEFHVSTNRFHGGRLQIVHHQLVDAVDERRCVYSETNQPITTAVVHT